MAWILLRFERLAAFETRKGDHAMRHQNIVFHSMLKHVPWHQLDRSVEKHGTDELARELTTKRHLIALLYGQLSGATSLREIVSSMESHETRLYHVGAAPVRRSTVSDANSKRPWQVFSELFAEMLKQAHRGLRRSTAEAVRLIDSTSLRLSSLSEDWAAFSTDVFGAKAHVVYDPNADRPVYFAVTPANVNDITAAKAMPIEPGATYVFDLGYYDYGWWAALDEGGCRLVTRLKKNTPFTVVRESRARQQHPQRSHRSLAGAPCQKPQKSHASAGTGASGHHRNRSDFAHRNQRP
jgi:Domain of unknown function (DUF4372)/Transposase DDE domain